jgi:hypothetical protein
LKAGRRQHRQFCIAYTCRNRSPTPKEAENRQNRQEHAGTETTGSPNSGTGSLHKVQQTLQNSGTGSPRQGRQKGIVQAQRQQIVPEHMVAPRSSSYRNEGM